MARQSTPLGTVLAITAGLGLVGYAAYRYGAVEWVKTRAAAPARPSVEIALLYGTEKEWWLKTAIDAFAAKRPDIKVTLDGLGTIDSVRAIAEGRKQPAIWSPADESP